MRNPDDVADFLDALPYVRSALAFVLLLRFGWTKADCYRLADEFIQTMKQDLGARK